MNNYRILVVDDEEDLCEILKFNLENEGYEVDTANSAEEALRMDIGSYNLLLLDVMMGEISGFKMASMLKKDKKTAQIPIIFITAKDTENDTVTGFNLGADDYISKPFSLREVAARVKAVLRRTQQGETEHAPESLRILFSDHFPKAVTAVFLISRVFDQTLCKKLQVRHKTVIVNVVLVKLYLEKVFYDIDHFLHDPGDFIHVVHRVVIHLGIGQM